MNTSKQSIELSISIDYVSEWGVWEGIRELFQNMMDGHDTGFPYAIEYDKNNATLSIINYDTHLELKTLLLGLTTKSKETDRGHFGEGYKLAFLSLLRKGKDIKIRTNHQTWTPKLVKSEIFDTTVITIDIVEDKDKDNVLKEKIEIQISPVSEKEKEMWLDRIRVYPEGTDPSQQNDAICFSPWKMSNAFFPKSEILLNKKFSDQLFIKGIYVGKLREMFVAPSVDTYEPLPFGLNLDIRNIDRNRELISKGDIVQEIRTFFYSTFKQKMESAKYLFFDAFLEKKNIINVLFSKYEIWNNEMCATLFDLFIEKYSDKTYVAASIEEQKNADFFGARSIVVPPIFYQIGKIYNKTVKDIQNDLDFEIKTIYDFDIFDQEQKSFFKNVVSLIQSCLKEQLPYLGTFTSQIVEFSNPNLLGLFQKKHQGIRPEYTISITKNLFDRFNKTQIIATLIHEFSHVAGKDGTLEHVETMSRLSASCIRALLS